MDTAWPARLGPGDRVRFDGWVHTIVDLHGGLIELSDPYGGVRQVELVQLLSTADFAVTTISPGRSPENDLAVTAPALAQAQWWRSHVVEVVTGLPPDAEPGAVPRPQYDPARSTLASREAAKAAELRQAGAEKVSVRTVRRKRHQWQAEGLKGLVDGRSSPKPRASESRRTAHAEVLRALDQVLAESGEPSRSVAFYWRATARLLEERGLPKEEMLSRAAFYRLYARATAAGELPSTKVRLSHGRWLRPGERVHVTTVSLGLAASPPGFSVAVTLAVDEASDSILDAVVHPARDRVDCAALVARMCTPAPLRPGPEQIGGWEETFQRPVWGQKAGQLFVPPNCGPVVRPETLVLDGSPLAGVDALRQVCQKLGISVRQSRASVPAVGAYVERIARQVVVMFTDRLHEAAGRPLHEIQGLLETWVCEVWQKTTRRSTIRQAGWRPSLTPNQAHAAAVAAAGWTALPLPPGEFLQFLPRSRRVVGPSGLRVNARRYDSAELEPLRNQVADGRSRPQFTVRWDPCDVRYVWIEGPSGRWITVPLVSASAVSTTAKTPGPVGAPVRITLDDEGAAGPSAHADSGNDSTRTPFEPASLKRGTPPPVEQWRRLVAASPSVLRAGWARTDVGLDSSDIRRVRYHAGLLLPTPSVVSVARDVERLDTLNKLTAAAKRSLIVCGAPGTGKTTALVEVGRLFEDRHSDLQRVGGVSSPTVVPSVYVGVPPAATARSLLAELLAFFGLPRPKRIPLYDLSKRVSTALSMANTDVVLIDDCDRLRATPQSRTQVTDVLTFLGKETAATFVFAGSGTWQSLAPALFHTSVRSQLLRAEMTHRACDDEWHAIVATAEDHLLLRNHVPGTLPALSAYLHQRTGGSLDRLAYLIRSGAIHAIRSGQEAITAPTLAELSGSWPHSPYVRP